MGRKRLENRVKPKVANELDGFEIKIDSFSEIKSNLKIDDLNKFLNTRVDDKKLRDREDLDEIKEQSKGREEN